MTVKPRTVDSLGVEVSKRYAQDQQLLDTKFLEASKKLTLPTEISVVTPYAPSEVELHFNLELRNTPWAFFEAPQFSPFAQALFSYQLIPRLGSFEKQQADSEKIAKLDLAKERKKKKKKFATTWQEEEEEKEEEHEREILKRFLEYIAYLNKELAFINGRRSQYHKG